MVYADYLTTSTSQSTRTLQPHPVVVPQNREATNGTFSEGVRARSNKDAVHGVSVCVLETQQTGYKAIYFPAHILLPMRTEPP